MFFLFCFFHIYLLFLTEEQLFSDLYSRPLRFLVRLLHFKLAHTTVAHIMTTLKSGDILLYICPSSFLFVLPSFHDALALSQISKELSKL